MNKPLNPLIEETVKDIVGDVNVRRFIMDILDIERRPIHRKNIRFEEALSEALQRGTD